MLRYLTRRVLIGCFTLVLLTLVIYGLIRAMPGDPTSIEAMSSERQIDTENFKKMREELGLNKPWILGYLSWLGDVARLDLGQSLFERRPVSSVIRERVGPTLLLSGVSLVLAYLLSIPLGIYCGARSGSWPEKTMSTFLYMLYSLPSFVAALYLLSFFTVTLGWQTVLPKSADQLEKLSLSARAWDLTKQLVLPVTCYTYGSLAYYVRFIRSNLQEAIRQDYVRTARAKGLPEWAVVVKHAFRNTLIPLVTLVGLTLPTLLSGSVILEHVLVWPGIGRLFYDKIGQRDYPVIMGLVLIFTVMVLLANLLADLLYAMVDPRITYA